VKRAYDVLVVGVGGMGAAALAHLAAPARGLAVVGVEQDEVPSARGSSAGETRVIRKAYAEDPRYVPLLVRAYDLWRELEARSGERLFERVGCLNLGPAEHAAIRGVVESVARHGLPHEVLDADGVRARFAVVPRAGDVGVFEEDAGFLRVFACTQAHARWAVASGAELRTGVRVTELDVHASGVTARLDDGTTIDAGHAVVSAGPWLASAPALRGVARALRLAVERQVQLWFDPAAPEAVRPPRLPAFIHFVEGGAYYGIPPDDAHPSPAVKVCRHHGGETTTADAVDRALRPADEADVRAYVRAHLPAADGPLVRSHVCMYTNTPDEHFVVGALPDAPHVVVLGGFSGHGYKMASVVGEIAADLVVSGRSAFDLGMFSPARFG
jgi:sarcosine oxidase